jgi:hypothetical protein
MGALDSVWVFGFIFLKVSGKSEKPSEFKKMK